MIASIMKIAAFLSAISQQRRAGLQAPGMSTLWSSVEQSLSIIMTCIPTMGSVMRTRVWNTGVAIFATVRRRMKVKAFSLTHRQKSNYEELELENRIPRGGFTGADRAGGYYGVTATCYKDNSDQDINLGENIRRTDHVVRLDFYVTQPAGLDPQLMLVQFINESTGVNTNDVTWDMTEGFSSKFRIQGNKQLGDADHSILGIVSLVRAVKYNDDRSLQVADSGTSIIKDDKTIMYWGRGCY
ncbi:hypothetical protein DL769_008648 [Monosporascus sp. CRB-8-3]|nr:hypothetical protein DL769_008648 [Monosporascus sp. CRB-8-3]